VRAAAGVRYIFDRIHIVDLRVIATVGALDLKVARDELRGVYREK